MKVLHIFKAEEEAEDDPKTLVHTLEAGVYKLGQVGIVNHHYDNDDDDDQIVHHCNYATIQLQQRLVTSYCSWEAAGQQLSRTQLQRKIQLCKNVMDCLAKVDAGTMIMLYILDKSVFGHCK